MLSSSSMKASSSEALLSGETGSGNPGRQMPPRPEVAPHQVIIDKRTVWKIRALIFPWQLKLDRMLACFAPEPKIPAADR